MEIYLSLNLNITKAPLGYVVCYLGENKAKSQAFIIISLFLNNVINI